MIFLDWNSEFLTEGNKISLTYFPTLAFQGGIRGRMYCKPNIPVQKKQ
jgi:hypothetical protein